MNKSTLTKKRPLTEEQKADADRLLALWVAWQERTKAEGKRPVTQGEFGYKHELGSQGMVWQYLHGATPLNLKAVMAFASAMECKLEDISPTLAEKAKAAGAAAAPQFFNRETISVPPPVPRLSHALCRAEFKQALPENLQDFVKHSVATESGKNYIVDYFSETLHLEFLVLSERMASRAVASAVLQLIMASADRRRVLAVVANVEEPVPLPIVVAEACRQFKIDHYFVKSFTELAEWVADLENVDPGEGAFGEIVD